MASHKSSADASLPSPPLADYFFITGIESTQIFDEKAAPVGVAAPPTLDTTIEENRELETAPNGRPTSYETYDSLGLGLEPRRASGLSFEARKSISSMLSSESHTASNRSSATTIKGFPMAGSTGLSEADFDKALRKFAAERDTFIEEIQFSAGVVPQPPKPKARAKAQKIVAEDVGGMRSAVGSVRRRLSTMNSLKRQPNPLMRTSSVRTSRRLSGYNSVIPTPQPFHHDPNMHPLRRRYEPVLLDRYPGKATAVDELKRRNPFPDYVPMFAFPNDVTVVSSDERPRATWHGFVMTGSDGAKLHGICLILWVPLNQKASEELERQCEDWRKANMSGEERELASSLGERLATERAKLSRLLARLPTMSQGSDERESLEEEISAVEEKIGLMTDLLRPVRHGAASKIEGLTDGETGLWIPRSYGVLGRNGGMTSFWKEWLRAVCVPMMNGAVLRVPASSPRVGMWQPLERYVVNLCSEAPSPISSITQVEIAIRELRLYARKEAVNELPNSRNIDLYALFRALSIQNIVTLFEYVMCETRIIFLSSHTAMLHLACNAIVNLIYPFKWSGIFIPVLPSRLIAALEAPCPYIVGIERRYEPEEYPDDEYVLFDLDRDTIQGTGVPTKPLPRQQKRKLTQLLHLAAPHHVRYGVPKGPPAYAMEAYPNDSYSSENSAIYNHRAASSTLSTLVSLSSSHFDDAGSVLASTRPLIFNAFLQARNDRSSRGSDQRPNTSSTGGTTRLASPPSPHVSPISAHFPVPTTPNSRSDSGFSLQATLREKRSGHFDSVSRRSSAHVFDPVASRRPSQPFLGHYPTQSISTLSSVDLRNGSSYAPSVYAQSTLAASTIMPGLMITPARNTDTVQHKEGHRMVWAAHDDKAVCSVCEDKSDEGIFKCDNCSVCAHSRCMQNVNLVCPSAFRPEQVRAAFVRCFSSLLYTYRRSMQMSNSEQKKNGLMFKFNYEGFLKSMPHENAEYMQMLRETQGFNEFIHERETKPPSDPEVKLFDQIILSKKNRGRMTLFHKATATDFLADASDHTWRTAAASPPSSRFPGDYRQVISRVPAKLDTLLMREPRVPQNVPRAGPGFARRRAVPSVAVPGGGAYGRPPGVGGIEGGLHSV
ncbi:DENN-domain-containing protein [Trichodelitschia bisporula]|uniref:DENN-domain-containing protein n=1 Tax=Trichodelitschia bisporula TaxID=703511 RepID=A0A6G1HSM3_9PEZI|nr:DENN-domain-containing protein [Trichodelitschia bisporula]